MRACCSQPALNMDASVDKPPFAWQPLTPRGVAAFARASFGRLLLVQILVALLAAGAILWFVHQAWFPVIDQAIQQLPPKGEISSGRLNWPEGSQKALAENHFLALTVDLQHQGKARSPAHVQVEFGQTDCEVFSLFGFALGAYPKEGIMAFNQPELAPWWGAWAPAILAIIAGLVISGLFASWTLLATLYSGPVWLVAFFADRDLTLNQSRRLAGAALMPGALFFTGAIVLYGLAVLDLVQLTAAAVVHLVITWGYLFASPLLLPRRPDVAPANANPFSEPAPQSPVASTDAQNASPPPIAEPPR
ncbi:MAG TPA: hypothetical protein VNZ22_05495 [Bacillota bacterium]|nr:hypothetical protein [Bacillota bacterium]